MGFLEGVGSALGVGADVAAHGIMDQFKAQVEQDRHTALMQVKQQMDEAQGMRTRAINKADAVTERARVAEFSKPVLAQKDAKTGLLSGAAGLNDAESVGADENVGYNVQKQMRDPTVQESSDKARMAGDLKSAGDIARIDDKEAANATRMKIAEMQQSAAFAKMDMQQQLGLARLDTMMAKAQGSGNTPTQTLQINELTKHGMSRNQAIDLVYNVNAKGFEYRTEEYEERDPTTGRKVNIVEKRQINKDKPPKESEPKKEKAPYAEGTKVKDKSGIPYTIRNGIPVKD